MYQRRDHICKYLKGGSEGAQCSVANKLIRAVEDADIQLCMNGHYEACSYYVFALRTLAIKAAAQKISGV